MKLKIISLLISLVVICTGCSSPEPDPAPGNVNRTVLVYMIANNNLSSYAATDINEMESVWNDQIDGDLYVFYNGPGNKNALYHIGGDPNPSTVTSRVVREYSNKIDPCNGDFLNEVIADVKENSPAESYGLFMWSHGTGWLPNNSSSPLKSAANGECQSRLEILNSSPVDYSTPQRSFGSNYFTSNELEMCDLGEILDGQEFEYIYFDACHMASIEALYELRGVTKYVISSVAETLGDGAPYNKIIPYMFGEKESTIQMAKEYYDSYNSQSSETLRSATISVVETSKLENLAAKLKPLVQPNPTVQFYGMQQFGRSSQGLDNVFYDLGDFVQKTWGGTKEYLEFEGALGDAVLYKAATPKVLNSIVVNRHCGVSCYIPRTSEPKTYAAYRTNYQWATDSGLADML